MNKEATNICSKLSLLASIATIVFLICFVMNIPLSIAVYKGNSQLWLLGMIGTPISCFIGILMAVLSTQEPASWYKSLGGFLNVLNLIIVAFIVMYLFGII